MTAPVTATASQVPAGGEAAAGPPALSYSQLFVRFLRFGLLAWGGPVAQIAMLRQELVEEERWVSRKQFNRVLAVYQVLPGPEAHELCVYFGYLARGRLGGLLAGLGFMLPGLVLMLLLSWFYVAVGLSSPLFAALFAGCQVAVAALIVRAVRRIGEHALGDRWLWGIAIVAAVGQLLGTPFYLSLGGAALIGTLRRRPLLAGVAAALVVGAALAFILAGGPGGAGAATPTGTGSPSTLSLFGSGLRAGLLTFGGAYTAIPFVQRDAVEIGGWMTSPQFLDGLALSGILPAPLVIFVTFVGYLGGGLAGALATTGGRGGPCSSSSGEQGFWGSCCSARSCAMTETVLFLCPHGAAKSVLAAALLRQLATDYDLPLRATCAGTDPDPEVAPRVRALLAEQGLVLPLERPRLVTAEQIVGADYVISLGCDAGELPQRPAAWEQWDDVPLPSQDLQGAYTRIQQRLSAWVAAYSARRQGEAHTREARHDR